MSRLALPRELGIARNLRLGAPVGRISATPYLGLVAMRSAVANYLATTNLQFNSRTSHTMRAAVSSFQVVFPNWYVNDSWVEAGPGTAATLTASIEYPVGTFTQIKFPGSASGTIPSAKNLISDPISLSIPKGGQFFIRTFWNNSAGVVVQYDAVFLAAYRPVAIIGTITQPSVLLLGDSRQNGFSNNVGAGSAVNVPQGECAGSIDPLFGYINAGVGGDQANLFVASHTNRAALGQYCPHIGCEYGVNDLDLSSLTSTQLISYIADHKPFPWQAVLPVDA
jgi:hypothetical protein